MAKKNPHKFVGFFMFPIFFVLSYFCLFCLSFSSLPLLFDILKPKKVPTRRGLWRIFFYLKYSGTPKYRNMLGKFSPSLCFSPCASQQTENCLKYSGRPEYRNMFCNFCLQKVFSGMLQAIISNGMVNFLWPKMARLGPFSDPKNPPEKVYVGPPFASFPRKSIEHWIWAFVAK